MRYSAITLLLFLSTILFSQPTRNGQWAKDGNGYYDVRDGKIIHVNLDTKEEKAILNQAQLVSPGEDPFNIRSFSFSEDGSKVLLYTNSKRVWRYDTRGDYFVFDLKQNTLWQVGQSRPSSSLLFAKFSPDGKKVAYVSEHNVYVENIGENTATLLTDTKGTRKLINGTFDWAYEEEFSCLDGFRWSPDSKRIAYWQIDANKIQDFYMVNTTDSIYSQIIPVEYPKVGELPSSCRIGVVDLSNNETTWMNVPGDPQNNYIPRMEWAHDKNTLILQQLNRKQNVTHLYYADVRSGKTKKIYTEEEDAWISIRSSWTDQYSQWKHGNGWYWLENGKSFLWITEKDGWRHIYKISRDGSKETLVTTGNYDIIAPLLVDEKNGYVYFTASPENATEQYLYRTNIDGKSDAIRLTPANQQGTHRYQISPFAKYASHTFSNYFTPIMRETVKLPNHEAISGSSSIADSYNPALASESNVNFFTVTTEDGIEMDGYMAFPENFDDTKKYPVVFYVYTEPAAQTVINRWGVGRTGLYIGNMAKDGYIYISVEGRGAPAPKGKEWRKAIYRKIGIVNIRDQAMACKKLIETYSFIDKERIAVHGWSGGGSTTLNLLFQYPELYQTGIAVAAVANQLSYDNIYQERYMGIPSENLEDFVAGSPITHAKNLEGNLLYIHGTGDDNVHYQNAEMLLNELIKYNKQFQFMAYPNRAHGIFRGEGTRTHLNTLFTNFLKKHCPPGPR